MFTDNSVVDCKIVPWLKDRDREAGKAWKTFEWMNSADANKYMEKIKADLENFDYESPNKQRRRRAPIPKNDTTGHPPRE